MGRAVSFVPCQHDHRNVGSPTRAGSDTVIRQRCSVAARVASPLRLLISYMEESRKLTHLEAAHTTGSTSRTQSKVRSKSASDVFATPLC